MSKRATKADIEEIEQTYLFEAGVNEIPPKDVFSFNELRSCADIYRMYDKEQLEIHPIYQRDVVWTPSDRTRFVDSLLKRLPIPSICLSLDADTKKMQVIDGLQRIDTIREFLDESSTWKLSKLEDIDKRISDRTVTDIRNKNPEVISDIENLSLPVTLLRCDLSKDDHVEYILTIFRRLNTGGLRLTNQEIRNAVFTGGFNDLIKECNTLSGWKQLLNNATGLANEEDRFKSREIILKFFAFYDKLSIYKPSLSKFLDIYMKNNRKLDNAAIQKKRDIFIRTTDFASKNLFDKKLTHKLNGVTFEAVLHGIAKNISTLEKSKAKSKINKQYASLLKRKAFSTETLKEGLYAKQKVSERFNLAETMFVIS